MTQPSPNINYLQYPNTYLYREISIGKRLVIVAQSDSGDFYNPTLVYNKDMAIDFFGGGKLVQLYEDATTYESGLDIYLMRMEPFGYETTFSVLEAFELDLLYIGGIYFDTHESVINQFISFSKTKEEKGNLVHGITSLSPSNRYHSILALESTIKELTIEYGEDLEETGKYLSIAVNQIEFKDAGAVYAGILASIDPEISPINKTIPNVKLTYEFNKNEISSLRSIGVVCFRSTFKKGVTCASSTCAVSTEGSVHKHISNFRIAQYLINQLSSEFQPLIGMSNITHQAMNVEDIINAVCADQVLLNRIRDYRYYLAINQAQGYIEVEIEAVPIFSIHSITTHSRVRIYK